MAGKYAPLQASLAALPRTKKSVTLSFKKLEDILEARLPKSASDYPEWWANQSHGPQAASWMGAGFVVDTVNLARRQVTFRRGVKSARSKQGKTTTKRAKTTVKTISVELLLKAGFAKAADWQLEDDRISLNKDATTKPAVYAHVVDGKVVYIGSATIGLKKRMNNNMKPGRTQSTSIRINKLIRDQLADGRDVWVIAVSPDLGEWNGLPVDMVLGIEGGLIKRYKPPWNKQGAK